MTANEIDGCPMIGGTVTAVRRNVLVVQDRKGRTTTVVESPSTSYTTLGRGRTAASGAAAVRVGDFVGVRGFGDAQGTLTAASVTVFSAPPFGRADPAPRGAPAA